MKSNRLRVKLPIALLIGLSISTLGYAQSDFWRQTNGPSGGNVRAVVTDSDGDLFAAVSQKGIYRSSDQGASWTPTNNGLGNPQSTGGVLAINQNGDLFTEGMDGIFRSTDRGNNWSLVNNGLHFVQTIAVSLTGDLYAGMSSNGVFRSTDNGANWVRVSNGLPTSPVNNIAVNSDGHLFSAVGGNGIYRSTDAGENWAQVNNGLTAFTIHTIAVDSDNELFAGSSQGTVFHSPDNGDTWTEVSSGLTSAAVMTLTIDSDNNLFAGTRGEGVFYSDDGGSSWSPRSTGLTHYFVNTLLVSGDNDIYAGTRGGGLFHSTDSANNWNEINDGLNNTFVNAMATGADGLILVGTGGGLFRSKNNGDTWASANEGLTNLNINALTNDLQGNLFAGLGNSMFGQGGISRSDDDGDSWTPVYTGEFGKHQVSSFVVTSNSQIFAGTGDGVIKSTDGGSSWVETNTGLEGGGVDVLAIGPNDVVFVGTEGLYFSENAGDSWTRIDYEFPNNNALLSLAINADGDIFVGTIFDGVLRSIDNGVTWTAFVLGQSADFVSALAINSNGDLFAASDARPTGGVFLSSDNGETWTRINGGLTNTVVKAFAFNSDGTIFAGTSGGGVFRSIEPTTSVTEDNIIPHEFVLGQNFPNPFNPTTAINYQLSKASEIELTLYNQLGQEVRTLVKVRKPAGAHQIEWDGRDHAGNQVASGVYLYRLKAGAFVQARKMVFLK